VPRSRGIYMLSWAPKRTGEPLPVGQAPVSRGLEHTLTSCGSPLASAAGAIDTRSTIIPPVVPSLGARYAEHLAWLQTRQSRTGFRQAQGNVARVSFAGRSAFCCAVALTEPRALHSRSPCIRGGRDGMGANCTARQGAGTRAVFRLVPLGKRRRRHIRSSNASSTKRPRRAPLVIVPPSKVPSMAPGSTFTLAIGAQGRNRSRSRFPTQNYVANLWQGRWTGTIGGFQKGFDNKQDQSGNGFNPARKRAASSRNTAAGRPTPVLPKVQGSASLRAINGLGGHFAAHKSDTHRPWLVKLVNQRRKLPRLLENPRHPQKYQELVERLGLRR